MKVLNKTNMRKVNAVERCNFYVVYMWGFFGLVASRSSRVKDPRYLEAKMKKYPDIFPPVIHLAYAMVAVRLAPIMIAAAFFFVVMVITIIYAIYRGIFHLRSHLRKKKRIPKIITHLTNSSKNYDLMKSENIIKLDESG